MFVRPAFVKTKNALLPSASNPIPIEAIPNIHEATEQNIQGGASEEHYHLTAAQLAYLISLQTAPVLHTETVVTNDSAAVSINNGDLVFAEVE